MENDLITWDEHPFYLALLSNDHKLIRQKIDEYSLKLLREHYITPVDFRGLTLIPYRGDVDNNVRSKSEIETHKLIFRCHENEFYPWILHKIIQYLMECYKDGHFRRKILRKIIREAPHEKHAAIKRMAYHGCDGETLIRTFNLTDIYERFPKLKYPFRFCLMGKDMRK